MPDPSSSTRSASSTAARARARRARQPRLPQGHDARRSAWRQRVHHGLLRQVGNAEMNSLLKCSIEDHECVKIAVLPAGPEGCSPRRRARTRATGSRDHAAARHAQERSWRASGHVVQGDGLELELRLLRQPGQHVLAPRRRRRQQRRGGGGRGRERRRRTAARSTSRARCSSTSTSSMPPAPRERADALPPEPAGEDRVRANPLRHAHTEGQMFGLTFWENGASSANDATTRRAAVQVVYYNGRTRQNTYEGACSAHADARARGDGLGATHRARGGHGARQLLQDPQHGLRSGCPRRRRAGLVGGARVPGIYAPRPTTEMSAARIADGGARAPARAAAAGRRRPRGRADDRGVREGHLHRGGRVPRGSALSADRMFSQQQGTGPS